MTPDLYEGFAERYDLTVGRWDEFDPAVAGFFRRLFGENGVRTVLETYDGGHGWRGDVYGRIGKALRWLQQKPAAKTGG